MTSQPGSSATAALTEKERRLVDVIVHASSRGTELTREQAGTAAGYGRGEVARVQASRALQRPHVRAALMDGLRECATIDAAASYGVLRHLGRKATSERVRLDAALAVARIGGLDQGTAPPPGPGVVLNLHLDPALATLLAQRQAAPPAPPVIEGSSEASLSLDQGADGSRAPGQGGGGA